VTYVDTIPFLLKQVQKGRLKWNETVLAKQPLLTMWQDFCLRLFNLLGTRPSAFEGVAEVPLTEWKAGYEMLELDDIWSPMQFLDLFRNIDCAYVMVMREHLAAKQENTDNA
jgi:hypothetical protein